MYTDALHSLSGQGAMSIADGTQAPIRRTTREPKRTGNPFIITREAPAQPRRVVQPETVKTREKRVPA